MSRSYPERPYVGVGAVIFRGADVLLVQRSKPPREGAWSLPGGAQKIGETVEQALTREIAEETGLAFTATAFLEMVDFIDRDGDGKVRHHYTLLDYWGVSGTGEIRAGGDAADARWVKVADIDRFGMWPKTVEVIRRADAIRQSDACTTLAPHSLSGHMKAIGWALLFGMGAYAVFMTAITLTRWAGLLE
jgi:ADP-ribose pyrophosphatase YjhB (NUDIX family)